MMGASRCIVSKRCFSTAITGNLRPSRVLQRTSCLQRPMILNHQQHGNNYTKANAFFSTLSSSMMEEQEYDLPVLPDPPVPPEPLETIRPKNMALRFASYFSIEHEQNRIARAEALFQAATRQASDPRWYGPGGIPRTFRSRHALLTLHIWLLHKRLLADTYDPTTALPVDEELFTIFWDDTTCRIRQQPNVMELAVNKHLLAVQQYSFLHLTHYDHAYTGAVFLQDPTARRKELRHLLWHHVWVRDPCMKENTCVMDRLVHYVDMNYQNICLTWPDAYYREARVAWVNLPEFVETSKKVHEEDVVPSPWIKNITRRGQDYYWNPETRESTWLKPPLSNSELEQVQQ